MLIHPGWGAIALRLFLAVLAGTLIGINRDEHGNAAGLRTTLLVCLAACLAMLQANLLMSTTGKAPDSFISMDVMRLPLGILSGIGFIGAGAIIKRGDRALGVTTAASIWFVTVVGLCFGGGQILLGVIGVALGLFVLSVMKQLEKHLPRNHHAHLSMTLTEGAPGEEEMRTLLQNAGIRLRNWSVVYDGEGKPYKAAADVRWRMRREGVQPPAVVKSLLQQSGVSGLVWKMSD
jgi:putative Mg2+ transporter-C (MgtC) family protein